MEMRLACLLVLALVYLQGPFSNSWAQSGFVSLRCCSIKNTTDGSTKITFSFDNHKFQNPGRCKIVPWSSTNNTNAAPLRGVHKNNWCFRLPVKQGQDYLVRTTLTHEHLLNSLHKNSFSVSIGNSIIDEVTFSPDLLEVEALFAARDNSTVICLIKKSGDVYFSKVELRPFKNPIYMGGNSTFVLKLIARVDLGNGDTVYRYSIDNADRVWKVDPNSDGATVLSSHISSLSGVNSSIPLEVLRTAVMDDNKLSFLHEDLSSRYSNYLIVVHFLELDASVLLGQRVFDILVNGEKIYDKFDIIENHSSSKYRAALINVQAVGVVNVSLVKLPHAKYGPICNGYEIFQAVDGSVDIVERKTNPEEDDMVGMIQEISATFRHSSKLYETQGNNLVAQISTIQPNTTTGSGNESRVVSRPPQRYNYVIGGLTVVSVALILVLIIFFVCYCKHVRKTNESEQQILKNPVFSVASIDEPFELLAIDPIVKPFTLQYIKNITGNCKTLIGEGGFGPVYRGMLPDGQEVAVKVRSATSTQGTREFDNEVSLLSTVQHDNLVPLLGYCCENDQQILVYPFMSNGSLQDRLYGEASKRKALDWSTRLSIALGAARGLMYLHTFAGRCIIHRDVKSSNILLDHSMCSKVADFGFSKYAPQEGDSAASLEVRGTAGYLDPEYYSTQQLSTKSDVFSFGIVLLEVITGREPLDIQMPRNEWSLVEWTKPFTREGRIDEIVDPSIKGGYHAEAMWRVVETALSCIEPFSTYRPNMVDIVRELEDALIIENNASEYMRSIESMGCSVSFPAIINDRKVLPPITSPIEPSPYCPIMTAPLPR